MEINLNVSGLVEIRLVGLEVLSALVTNRGENGPKKSNKSQTAKPAQTPEPEPIPEPEEAPETQPETKKQVEPELALEPEPIPEITRKQVQSKARQLATAGKQVEVRGVITAFNIQKISDLPLEKCAEALAALEAIA